MLHIPAPRLQKGVPIGQLSDAIDAKSPLQPVQVPVAEQMGALAPQPVLLRQLTHWPESAPLETQSGVTIAGQTRLAAVPKLPLHASQVFRVAVTSQAGVLPRQTLTLAAVQAPHNRFEVSQIVPLPLPLQWLSPRHSTQAPICAPTCTQAGKPAVGQARVALLPSSPLQAAQTLFAGVVLQTGDVPGQALRLADVHVPQVPFAVSQIGPLELPTQLASLPHSVH